MSPAKSNPPHKGPKYVVKTEKFDFVAQRKVPKPTNILESTGHLVKGCLGAGVLGIHEAYMKCGLWVAVISTVIFGFYISYCVHLLISSAHLLYERIHVTKLSYPDVAEVALEVGPFPSLRKFSKLFRYAVDATICIDLFGACAVYQIIIAKTIQVVTGDRDTVTVLRMYILIIFLPILLLCMITTLKYLAPFSLVADFFIVTCVVATVVYSLEIAPPIEERPAFKSFIGFFEFSGVVVFSMEGVGVSLPIENNMKDPRKFRVVLVAGMMVVVSFVLLVGFFGYWGFGELCDAPVTLNFKKGLVPTILQVLIALMVYVTFALNFWAPFNLCWYYLQKRHDPEKFWLWERVYRAIIVICITATSIAFPNIGNLMGLIGAFCLSNMGFIFPAIIDLLVVWEHPGLGTANWRLYKNILILIAGIILFVSGTFFNAKALLFG
uniref:Amino acid transporter transmembrane domain-containing protein n=1 Tax=Heliothis virescens TaxID=7102 RepID=A0A2A4K6B7_HELVI